MVTTRIGFLLFPGLLQLDCTGAYGVFAAAPGAEIHLIWKDTAPVVSSDKLVLTPTTRMADCPDLDVLCVPGGGGILPLLGDDSVLDFLRAKAATSRYVTSVCTGALVLGAAGLLRGYRATTHWQSWELLSVFGAFPEHKRVVVDRNRVTAAGVSSGIDMALTLAGMLWGDGVAQEIQLGMEYAPAPPYAAGDAANASPAVVAALRERNAKRQQERVDAAHAAAKRL
jgi:cyclohexyl-isocyanide hydratase